MSFNILFKNIMLYSFTGCFALASVNVIAQDENTTNFVAQNYAKTYNVDLNEANRRLDIMAKYSDIEEELKSEFGDDIAGVYFDSTPERLQLTVRTTKKGQTLKRVQKFLHSIELPVQVIPNSPRNYQSILNIIDNQGRRLARQNDSIQLLGYNPKLDAISIFIYEPDLQKQEQMKNDKNLQKISGMPTEFVFIDEPIQSTALYGGAEFEKNIVDGGVTYQNPCTTGFPATYSGRRGFVTAAHCADENNPIGTPYKYKGYDGVVADMKMTVYDAYAKTHDMAFIEPVSSSAYVSNQYYTDKSGTNFNTVKTPIGKSAKGSYLCHQGRTTGASCGTVTHVNVESYSRTKPCPAWSLGQKCAPTMVIMQSDKATQWYTPEPLKNEKGDSGGPVYGAVPFGIASAGAPGIVIYSQLQYLSELGVQLQ